MSPPVILNHIFNLGVRDEVALPVRRRIALSNQIAGILVVIILTGLSTSLALEDYASWISSPRHYCDRCTFAEQAGTNYCQPPDPHPVPTTTSHRTVRSGGFYKTWPLFSSTLRLDRHVIATHYPFP